VFRVLNYLLIFLFEKKKQTEPMFSERLVKLVHSTSTQPMKIDCSIMQGKIITVASLVFVFLAEASAVQSQRIKASILNETQSQMPLLSAYHHILMIA
jgi:hypothetical protein